MLRFCYSDLVQEIEIAGLFDGHPEHAVVVALLSHDAAFVGVLRAHAGLRNNFADAVTHIGVHTVPCGIHDQQLALSVHQAVIHNRYDTAAVLSPQRIRDDSLFIAAFAGRMADAARCPVGRAIPQKVRDELDVYLNRKRKE